MKTDIKSLTQRKAWKALVAHRKKLGELHLRDLFSSDPDRGKRMTAEAAGLFLDYSKNRITEETLNLLIQLAMESGLEERREAMFRGEKINVTENRAVLHVALRAPRNASITVDGRNALAQRIIPELESATEPNLNHDSSTNNLIRRYRELKQTS